jgi:hypothetical protein
MAAFLGCAEALQGVRDLLVGRPTNVNVKAAPATFRGDPPAARLRAF